jgi:hypothetical protein
LTSGPRATHSKSHTHQGVVTGDVCSSRCFTLILTCSSCFLRDKNAWQWSEQEWYQGREAFKECQEISTKTWCQTTPVGFAGWKIYAGLCVSLCVERVALSLLDAHRQRRQCAKEAPKASGVLDDTGVHRGTFAVEEDWETCRSQYGQGALQIHDCQQVSIILLGHGCNLRKRYLGMCIGIARKRANCSFSVSDGFAESVGWWCGKWIKSTGGGYVNYNFIHSSIRCTDHLLFRYRATTISQLHEEGLTLAKELDAHAFKNVMVLRGSESFGAPFLASPFRINCISMSGIAHPSIDRSGNMDSASTSLLRAKLNVAIREMICIGSDTIVLGAWGCGVYACPPAHVAQIMREGERKQSRMVDLKLTQLTILQRYMGQCWKMSILQSRRILPSHGEMLRRL